MSSRLASTSPRLRISPLRFICDEVKKKGSMAPRLTLKIAAAGNAQGYVWLLVARGRQAAASAPVKSQLINLQLRIG